MSGQPGKSLRWIRYRYPIPKISDRTTSSGRVFFDFTLDMTQLRKDGSVGLGLLFGVLVGFGIGIRILNQG